MACLRIWSLNDINRHRIRCPFSLVDSLTVTDLEYTLPRLLVTQLLKMNAATSDKIQAVVGLDFVY